jgi:uncharacterized membrane protein YphA (DoxX/SURF4 family)
MTSAAVAATLLSAALVLVYGFLVLFFDGMRAEFERFGLSRFRRLTGILEVLGGAGLLVGLLVPEVLLVAAGGLTSLMVLGVLTRIRVRDPLLESLPAWGVLALNAFITVSAWGLVTAA